MTAPSTAARLSGLSALGSAACVVAVLGAGLVASPEGMLIVLALLGFASVPALVGGVMIALGGRKALRGERPVGQLLTSAVLLLPGAVFATLIGVEALHPSEELSTGTAFASRVALVCGPTGWLLAAASPLLLLPRARPRLRVVPLIGWANLVVLVLALGSCSGWVEPRLG